MLTSMMGNLIKFIANVDWNKQNEMLILNEICGYLN